MSTNRAQINRAIRKAGIDAELMPRVPGAGTFHFCRRSDGTPQDGSVYVFYMNQLTTEQWIDEARAAEF